MLDTWNTNIDTPVGKFLSGMCYYIMSEDEITRNSAVLTNCNAIHSCYWSPILTKNNVGTFSVDYDVERFGKLNNGTLDFIPKLNRISSVTNVDMLLKEVDIYKIEKRVKEKNWRNESKLYNFPYQYAMITDYMNVPIELQYHLIPQNRNRVEIRCKCFVTEKGTYSIYVSNLKGDYFGGMEGSINSAPLEVPVGSTAYATWSSTQKAQDLQNTRNAIMNSNVDMFANGLGMLGDTLSLNVGGAVRSGVGMYQSYQSKVQAIGNRSAQQKDLRNTPRTMTNTGSDVGFSMVNGKKKINLIRYRIDDEYMDRLCDFFTMYGYKQSKMLKPNTRDRYYFNYIKSLGMNIRTLKGIPREHLDELQKIYDNGVTLWHIDRPNVTMFDYSLDNYEI